MLYVAFGTNASIARKLVIASADAAVFIPVVPGVTSDASHAACQMPAGACETLTRIMVH
jgi:hypothetical protein